MGVNLLSCCHRCKTKVFHFRGEENKTMIPFYTLHGFCIRIDSNNVETKVDTGQHKNWMQEYDDGGYEDQWKYDSEKQEYIFGKDTSQIQHKIKEEAKK